MTTHRHKDSRGIWTTSVTDPNLAPYATDADVAALAARVTKLEADLANVILTIGYPPTPPAQPPSPPTPPPPVTPPPAPPAAWPWANLQAGINATAVGGTLNATGYVFTESVSIPKAMTLIGGTIKPPSGACAVLVTGHGVTLNGVQVNGAGMADQYAIGIRTFKANNVTITGCNVYDCKYAGIMVLSAQTGTVTNNTIRRIGVGGTVGVTNAYGIAISSQNPATDAAPTDVMVSGNVVEDVPTWHALDTHAGVRITFKQNTVRTSRSPVFVTGDSAGRRSTDCDVDDNDVYGGATAYWALTNVYSTGGYLRNNTVYDWPSGQEILTSSGGDPDAVPINLTISNNTIVP